jgi:hypothetical protein
MYSFMKIEAGSEIGEKQLEERVSQAHGMSYSSVCEELCWRLERRGTTKSCYHLEEIDHGRNLKESFDKCVI